jgi:hypothetical protein
MPAEEFAESGGRTEDPQEPCRRVRIIEHRRGLGRRPLRQFDDERERLVRIRRDREVREQRGSALVAEHAEGLLRLTEAREAEPGEFGQRGLVAGHGAA